MEDAAPAIPDVLAEVGPRLRRLRTRRGVTLTALAAKTGISRSTLSRLEGEQRSTRSKARPRLVENAASDPGDVPQGSLAAFEYWAR